MKQGRELPEWALILKQLLEEGTLPDKEEGEAKGGVRSHD